MRDPGPGIIKDTRGLSQTEYLIVLVLLAVAGVGAYRLFGDLLTDQTESAAALIGGPDGADVAANPPAVEAIQKQVEAARQLRREHGEEPVSFESLCGPGGCGPDGQPLCFAAGTPVLTTDGLRPIETLRAGDLVLARDEEGGETAPRRVVRTTRSERRPVLAVTLVGDGRRSETIRVTPEHPFFVEGRGWVRAGSLRAGDPLVSAAGEARVLIVRDRGERTTVHNLEVEDFHTYFVGESRALVHNQCDPATEARLRRLLLLSPPLQGETPQVPSKAIRSGAHLTEGQLRIPGVPDNATPQGRAMLEDVREEVEAASRDVAAGGPGADAAARRLSIALTRYFIILDGVRSGANLGRPWFTDAPDEAALRRALDIARLSPDGARDPERVRAILTGWHLTRNHLLLPPPPARFTPPERAALARIRREAQAASDALAAASRARRDYDFRRAEELRRTSPPGTVITLPADAESQRLTAAESAAAIRVHDAIVRYFDAIDTDVHRYPSGATVLVTYSGAERGPGARIRAVTYIEADGTRTRLYTTGDAERTAWRLDTGQGDRDPVAFVGRYTMEANGSLVRTVGVGDRVVVTSGNRTSTTHDQRIVLAPDGTTTARWSQTDIHDIRLDMAGGLRVRITQSHNGVLMSVRSTRAGMLSTLVEIPFVGEVTPRVVRTEGNTVLISLDGSDTPHIAVAATVRPWGEGIAFRERRVPYYDAGNLRVVMRDLPDGTESLDLQIATATQTFRHTWVTPLPADENYLLPPRWQQGTSGYWRGTLEPRWGWRRNGQFVADTTRVDRAWAHFVDTYMTTMIRGAPVVGTIVMAGEALVGTEITGRRMTPRQRVIHGAFAAVGAVLEFGPAALSALQTTRAIARIQAASGVSRAEARALLDEARLLNAEERALLRAAAEGRAVDPARLAAVVGRLEQAMARARGAAVSPTGAVAQAEAAMARPFVHPPPVGTLVPAPPNAILRFNPDNAFGELHHLANAMAVDPSLRILISTPSTPRGQAVAEEARAYLVQRFGAERVVSRDVWRAAPETLRLTNPEHAATATIVAALRRNPAQALAAMREGLGAGPIPAVVRQHVDAALGEVRGPIALVWNRQPGATGAGADRVMTPEMLRDIVTRLQAQGITPVILGPPPTGGTASLPGRVIDLTNHHTALPQVQAQLQMIEYLRQRGAIAQIGMMSGGLDQGAFIGLPTLAIAAETPTFRMGHLAGRLPNYREITPAEIQGVIRQLGIRGSIPGAVPPALPGSGAPIIVPRICPPGEDRR